MSFAHDVEELLVADLLQRSVTWLDRGCTAFERTSRSAVLDLSEEDLSAID